MSTIELFSSNDGQVQLQVTLDGDTVWLSQAQLAELLDVQRAAITKQLGNIFKSKELDEISVCSILEHTADDGKTYKTKFYNLDAVISVGYRINSTRAIHFRQWATKVLKQHLIQGYSINQHRMEQQGVEFQQVIDLLKLRLISNNWLMLLGLMF